MTKYPAKTMRAKDPDSVLSYGIDWQLWLGAGIILTSAWTVPTGLTKVSESNTDKATAIVLSGGTIGASYDVTNIITTVAGLTDSRTIRIPVAQR